MPYVFRTSVTDLDGNYGSTIEEFEQEEVLRRMSIYDDGKSFTVNIPSFLEPRPHRSALLDERLLH